MNKIDKLIKELRQTFPYQFSLHDFSLHDTKEVLRWCAAEIAPASSVKLALNQRVSFDSESLCLLHAGILYIKQDEAADAFKLAWCS